MGSEYGNIGSRNDFFRVLAEAQTFMRRLLGWSPDEPTLQSIAGQLEAMRRWSAGGRTPERAERMSLDLGLRATRELGNMGDTALDTFINQLGALHNYFEDWPSDERASRVVETELA